MKTALVFVAVLAAASLCLQAVPVAAEGTEVDSGLLLREWEKYDGKEVIFRGEAVGDVLWRGESAWVAVNDDPYSQRAFQEAGELRGGNSGIGVWMPAAEAEKIKRLGRYRSLGDYLEIVGVFHADCGEHGGDFDIHAVEVRVLRPGREVDVSPEPWKWWASLGALVLLAVTVVPIVRRSREERRSTRGLERELP